MAINAIERYRMARARAWQWRLELSWVKKLGLSLGIACFVGLLAQARIPLPWTPVPITGQTFGVLLAAVLLGQWWSGVSMAIYVGLGVAGLPWFNGLTGGLQSLVGPTGGYLIGFIMAALFIGFCVDKYIKARRFWALLALMLCADFILVFVPGLIQLNIWLKLTGNNSAGLNQVLAMGLLPFVAGDVIKVVAAASAGWELLPKKRFRVSTNSRSTR